MSVAVSVFPPAGVAELVAGQLRADDERARAAQLQLELAMADHHYGARLSAASAIRRALLLNPLDESIQQVFREIYLDWRNERYSVQDWRDAYLSAQIAFLNGDLSAAASESAGLDQRPPGVSYEHWSAAVDLRIQVENRVMAAEAASQLAMARLQAGNEEGARAICQRYLQVAPRYEWLESVARQSGLALAPPDRDKHARGLTALETQEPLAALIGLAKPVYYPASWLQLARSTTSYQVLCALLPELPARMRFVSERASEILDALEDDDLHQARALCVTARAEFDDVAIFVELLADIEAQLAAAAWEQAEYVLEIVASTTDLDARRRELMQAMTSLPDDDLFLREWELTSKEMRLRTMPAAPSWVVLPDEVYPPRARYRKWWPAVAAAAAIAGLVFLKPPSPPQQTAAAPAASLTSRVATTPLASAGPSGSVSAGYPVRVISSAPVSVFLDFKLIGRFEHGLNESLSVPPGDHVLSIGRKNAMVHLFTKTQGGNPAPEVHSDGLEAAVISGGQLSLSNLKTGAFQWDGKALRTGGAPVIKPGHHTLRVDGREFAFYVVPAEPLVLVTAAADEEKGSPELAEKDLRQRAVKVHALLARLAVPPKPEIPHHAPAILPPPIVDSVDPPAAIVPEQSASLVPVSLPSPPPLARESREADAGQVLQVLRRYSDAWRAKDPEDITQIRPALSKRTVRDDLKGVAAVAMTIRPTGMPQVDGNRAVVECLHQVTQTYTDGVRKSSPEVRMKYVLVKRGGSWVIEQME